MKTESTQQLLLPITLPDWVIRSMAGPDDPLCRSILTFPGVEDGLLNELDCINAGGSGIVQAGDTTWSPGADDPFRRAVSHPWQLPSSRMIGAYDPPCRRNSPHRCTRMLGGVFFFINTTDFVDELVPLPLWIIVTTRRGGGMHVSRAYRSPGPANAYFAEEIGAIEEDFCP